MVSDVLKFDRVYGVDFSGAEDAGRKIWIAQAIPAGGGIRVEECAPAAQFLRCPAARGDVLPALREFITGAGNAAFGCDFPFSLPKESIPTKTWVEFLTAFPSLYCTADEFRQNCMNAALSTWGRKELKRLTDVEAKAPFCVYNLRIFRQTYYGIRDVLRPLVVANLVNVPPMLLTNTHVPWVIEVCPAATLKALGHGVNKNLHTGYKGREPAKRAKRQRILDILVRNERVSLSRNLASEIVSDTEGDALDSVIAADAAWRAMSDPRRIEESCRWPYTIEGFIYV